MITTIGTSAATAPLTLMIAVRSATSSMVSTSNRVWLVPACAMSCCPAQAVTPVESSASLTTNSEAMNSTVGSPNPLTLCSMVSTPVAHSERATPSATTSTGSRFHTNSTTATPRITKVIVLSDIGPTLVARSQWSRRDENEMSDGLN